MRHRRPHRDEPVVRDEHRVAISDRARELATRMTKPLNQQRIDQIAVPAIEHAIYGATTAAVFEGIQGATK